MGSTIVSDMNIELQASITIDPNSMKVIYEIKNLNKEDIFVIDGLFQMEESPKLDPSYVYTIFEDGTLTLFRGLLSIPVGIQVEVPEVPYARLLPAGKAISGTIDVSLPLSHNHPYEWIDRVETRRTRKVGFRIGYLMAKDLKTKPNVKTIDGTNVYRFGYRDVVDVQHVLETPAQKGVVEIHVKP